ncbi:MAG: glycosyl transferase family 1, partial [Gammaproteobacteria bacterium]
MRIAMVVWNEFRNDARVLKEAETLQAEGYQVTVHALHTPGVTEEREILASGVHVVRVARSPFWRWRKRTAPSSAGSGSTAASRPAAGPIGKTSLWMQVLRIVARLWTHIGLVVRMVRSHPDVVHAHDV